MVYQALYRVYRPQSFEDVVGQRHIVQTLQNALLQEKFSHAYLFSGPRGTGKTTAAKIVSKAVNCEQAPTAEPCNECASCRGIMDGSISDVIEIDAASNNGVDEIRDIRDKVKYAPSSVRYKVYIIDEVHMLSIGAFNALLKTLEEPPPHVIFILATTEPHKIPLTIVSRCQRFDFKRISPEDSVFRMKSILSSEDIKVDDQALYEIAKAAEGGMRDALSLLDQAISYSDDVVTLEDVLLITGAVSQEFLLRITKAVYEKNTVEALDTIDKLIQNGKDPNRFLEDIIYYYRDILLYQTNPALENMFEKAVISEEFKQLSNDLEMNQIYEIIHKLNEAQQEMKWTNHPRVLLEVLFVKLCQEQRKATVPASSETNDLTEKVKQLEMQIQQLKEQGIRVEEGIKESAPDKKPTRSPRSSYKVPTNRIYDILGKATRKDLDAIRRNWAEVLETLRQQNKASHAALLLNSEPVAASSDSFVLKFKYEIHCKMAAENNNNVRDNLENILYTLVGSQLTMIAVPEPDWEQIRQGFLKGQENEDGESSSNNEEDPLIAEAKKLFGEELIEVEE
ncbi:DNA polymerase III subunit gamma/tau [Priestia koreensis]|uniref:DNA polymerase III subunit gamma/tau n=1 Tax=Priestia koreensis TaxID=284581 RepID=UPI00203C80A5|nr:DNA polymerase III subunit gamma/tau [Priestia koreensis]